MEPGVDGRRPGEPDRDVLIVGSGQNDGGVSVGVDAAGLFLEDLLGNLRGVAPIYHYLDAVRRPSIFVPLVGRVFIRGHTGHALHVVQDSGPDTFQHHGGPVENLVSVGLPELRIGLLVPAGDVGTQIHHAQEAGVCLHDVRDDALREQDVAGVHSSERDDSRDGIRSQVFRQDQHIGRGDVLGLNPQQFILLVHGDREILISDCRRQPFQDRRSAWVRRSIRIHRPIDGDGVDIPGAQGGYFDGRLVEGASGNLPGIGDGELRCGVHSR